MRTVTVQVGTRVSDVDDTVPVVISVSDDGEAHPEWAETAARIAGHRALAVFGALCGDDEPAEGDPPKL